MTEPSPKTVPPLDLSTRLAIERTRVAYERTAMAWVRTGTSMITFGFGVYKLFQIERPPSAREYLIGPQEFGLVLVSIGLAALTLSTLEYRQNMRSLGVDYLGNRGRLTLVFTGLVATLGILAFAVMLFRQ